MLTQLGRKADLAVARGTDAVHGAAHATVRHLRRIAGAVSTALGDVAREATHLV